MKLPFGNRATEKDIRDWLASRGYAARSALFEDLELHGIERPGWHQVFRFEVQVAFQGGSRKRYFGVVDSDERYGRPVIQMFEHREKRDQHLNELTDGMLTAKSRYRN